jgi:hypothetical protein
MMKLAIGISDFSEIIRENYYYADKSLFIKDVLDDTKVILITRPRRFGKTLNLSMLKHFFAKEVMNQPTHELFKNLKISEAGDEYLKHQGRYPVIFISLKDIKERSIQEAEIRFRQVISELYIEHRYLLEGEHLAAGEKKIYEKIMNQEEPLSYLKDSLKKLTAYLYRYHGQKVIVLIDEYDTPIQEGYVHNYYDDIMNFFRGFLGASLKDNSYMFKAVITGILRVSKESLFSDLNNIKVYTLLSSRYSDYFGFTEGEVLALLQKACLQEKLSEIKDWYNGYQVANTILYNPWSIINCISEQGLLRPYWVNTAENSLIKKLFIHANANFKSQLEILLKSQAVEMLIDEQIVFGYMQNNEMAIWSLLLMAGYLKVISQEYTDQGLLCTLSIPNREVRNLYRQVIEQWLADGHAINWYNRFLEYLLTGNIPEFKIYLEEVFLSVVSVHDVAKYPEAFYHGLMLGFTASLDRKAYDIKSNRESGYGRYDLAIIPTDPQKLVILMEFKAAEENNLQQTAEQALQQIDEKQYAAEFLTRGLNKVLKIGISFCGKKLCVVSSSP